jgi:hypothetical protein
MPLHAEIAKQLGYNSHTTFSGSERGVVIPLSKSQEVMDHWMPDPNAYCANPAF